MKLPNKKDSEYIWILVYTRAQQEKKANENLQKQGFKTFLPLIAKSNKQTDNSLSPIFPRYIFTRINIKLDNWTVINSSYGVSHIVMFGEEFAHVPTEIIKSIQSRLNEQDVYKENISLVDYHKGDSLIIKKGHFAGIDAIFLSNKSKDRVRLLLKLLNTTIVSEISKSDIGLKERVKNFKL